jgi:cyclase
MKVCTLLLAIICSVSVPVYAQQAAPAPAAPAPVTLQQVAPNIYMTVGGRGAQGGVYLGEKEVLLIDSKQDSASVAQVLAEIGKLTSNPVTRLVNTHADADHVFGNRFQPKGVTFIAHENCLAEFSAASMSGTPSDWNNPELKPFLPSVTYKDRMDLRVGAKTIELWHFGTAHTTGDTVVYFPDEQVAFIGDQVFVGRVQLIHAYKGGSALGNVANLERMLAALPAEKFVSGHSEIQDRAGVRNHVASMRAMQEKVRGLKANGMPLEDVRKQFAQNEAALVGVIYGEMR